MTIVSSAVNPLIAMLSNVVVPAAELVPELAFSSVYFDEDGVEESQFVPSDVRTFPDVPAVDGYVAVE